jgi:adenylate cyclase
MRFRTKVSALFIIMAILTGLLIAGFMFGPTKRLFMDLMRTNVLPFAALFADARGFTNFAEQLSPEETVTMLNGYFEKMIDAVFKNFGHLNKFRGDGLMALFGALGIGVNTGLSIVGNIGSEQRMEFTLIGNAINFAARLEQATPERGADILVSQYTYVATRSRFPFERAGEISLKAKSESVRAYTIGQLA